MIVGLDDIRLSSVKVGRMPLPVSLVVLIVFNVLLGVLAPLFVWSNVSIWRWQGL